MFQLVKKKLALYVGVFLVAAAIIFLPMIHSNMHVAVAEINTVDVPKGKEASDLHEEWAKKVQKGGYILHFRHAQREKWHDVTAFDALELRNDLKAENESFAKATCLTPQGVEEAKMIGEILTLSGTEISQVYTSPSCRARQTSQYAFGGEGILVNALLHRTAIMVSQHEEFALALRDVIDKSTIVPGKNVVLSGHGGTLRYDKSLVIDKSYVDNIDGRQEGGFVVLEKKDGKVIARHKFNSFHEYANVVVELPSTR